MLFLPWAKAIPSYQSDGQKWNLWLLKCYMPPTATWTELVGLSPPTIQGDEDNLEDTHSQGEDIPREEGHRYMDRDRHPPDRFSPEDFRQKKPNREG